jgi:cytochrome c peroxidase
VRKPFASAPAAARTRVAVRPTAFRKFATESAPPPAPKSSNTLLYAGIGAAAFGGVTWYIFASDSDTAKTAGTAAKSGAQAVKAATHFTPTKEDYIKVNTFVLEKITRISSLIHICAC